MADDLLPSVCCPVGHRCESCGTEDATVAVKVSQTVAGQFCWSGCLRCRSAQVAPAVSLSTAGRLVQAHDQHLVSAAWGIGQEQKN